MLALNLIGKKRCARCGENRLRGEFPRAKSRSDGLYSYCRKCCTQHAKHYYQKRDPDLHREKQRAYRATHREQARERRHRWEQENPDKFAAKCARANDRRRGTRRGEYLQFKYGITEERYQAMHAAQGGLCEICRDPEQSRSLHVDHDHSTGAVRGLLCSLCNKSIGMLRESADRMLRAIDYLTRHRLADAAPEKT